MELYLWIWAEKKAREHYKKALKISRGVQATLHVNLATAVSTKNQNIKEFKDLLNKALDVDVNKEPKFRLVNILAQRKAQWLLDHLDNYFLIDSDEEEDDDEDEEAEEE